MASDSSPHQWLGPFSSAAARLPPGLRHALRLAAPDVYTVNHLLARPHFVAGHGRPPRSAQAKDATLNDYVFERMLRGRWSALERLCVDKQHAKAIAATLAGVQAPPTLTVLSLFDHPSLARIEQWLRPFVGQRAVLKPTHSSGRVMFLDQTLDREALADFVEFSRRSLFQKCRETQYRGLEKKLIVEANIHDPGAPMVDYKFLCSRGEILCCDVHIDRFSDRTCALCGVPDLEILDVGYVGDKPAVAVDKPQTLPAMIAAAQALSAPFDFVRVDLYSARDQVYFGEFTFSPCAGCAPFSDEAWAVEALAWVRRSIRANQVKAS